MTGAGTHREGGGEGFVEAEPTAAGVSVPEKIDLELDKYLQNRGEKKLPFDPAVEFK